MYCRMYCWLYCQADEGMWAVLCAAQCLAVHAALPNRLPFDLTCCSHLPSATWHHTPQVSIVPRGSAALGFAQYLPNENMLMTTEQVGGWPWLAF